MAASRLEPAAPVAPAPPPAAEASAAAHPRPSVRRAVSVTLRTSLLVQAINTASGVELARGLGLEGRGELAAAMLWPTVIGAVATLGIEESLTYHVAREGQRVGRLLGSALVLCAVQALAFTALTAAAVPLVLSGHGGAVVVSALIYALYVPLNLVGLALTGTLNGAHRYEWSNGVRLTIGVLVLAAQTALLVAGAMTVRGLVVAIIGCYVVMVVVAALLVRRTDPGPLSWDAATLRSLFGYGIRSHASTTSNILNQRLDQLVISAFLPARQLGLYVVGVTFTSLTALIGGSVAYGTLPNVAGAAPAERLRLARRSLAATALLSAAVSLPILVLAPQLIGLFFGAAFVPAAPITRILAVAVVVLSVNRVLEAVLRGAGRPLDAGVAELVALGATVAGLATLLPLLGLAGAAWASALAYAVAGGWMLRRTARALDVPVARLVGRAAQEAA